MTPFRDEANLLSAAGRAIDALELRVEAAQGPTITMAVDELRELTEQFERVVSFLTIAHLSRADVVPIRRQDAA